ncbi:MAG: DnaA/Hda family protein [Nitrospinota bacterium]|nr:DnaA/Hda family protein [Nitrospinota bacterium]
MLDTPSQAHQLLLNFPNQPQYSFSNFIVSEGSRFAFSMAQKICDGGSFSTLHISGERGLGKTHLLMSIGNHLAENFPDRKALYLDCITFVKTMDDSDTVELALKQILKVDYFLLDNVDQIAGHPHAQEKLYFIYNSLMEMKKVIVFTGGLAPERLPSIADDLTSRFQWGVLAQLKPIDDATTARIIEKLGFDLELEIPNAIITYLLNRIPRDFQSIQNAVTLINQESYVQKKKVTLPLVKKTLGLGG